MISSDDESNSTPSEKQCSQSKCKTILPPGSKYKTCEKFHNLATTAASFAHRGSGKDRKGRRSTGVRVGGSIFRKQLRMAGRETDILSLIAIMRSPLKKTRWVLIPFIQEDQTFIPTSNVPMISQDSRWLGIMPMDSSIKFHSRIAASWKHFKKKGQGSSSLQKTVSVVNVNSIQARKRLQQHGRAQLPTRCFIEHAHEQMKHNQIKLDFLLYILPQLTKYNNSSYRAVGALLKGCWSGNWALDKILIRHVTCPGRGWGWGAGEAHGRLACQKSRVLKFFFYTPVRCGRGR